MRVYVHQPVDEEIRSIGGYYKVLQEGVLDLDGREVLYVLKAAHVDTSCCGEGGMGYISVPGFVVSFKSSLNEQGLAVSEVERIREENDRRKVRGHLKNLHPFIEVVDFD